MFAFALTLLVVSLEVPREMHDLLNLMRGFLPFAATFAAVCWIWHQHYVFFRRYAVEDGWTIVLNCTLLFLVLFYVYPLKFLTMGGLGRMAGMDPATLPHVSDGRAIMLLYSAGVGLIFLTFALLHLNAWRQRDALALGADEAVVLRYAVRGNLGTIGVAVLSVAIALIGRADVWIATSGFVYFLIGPVQAINGIQESRARRALAAASRAN